MLFELWCWRRLLRVPWTARRSNQSILKEISPECSLKGLMLKLKLQHFGHRIQRPDSLEKTLMLGKDWRQEEKWTTEDEMVGWHQWLNAREFEQAPGVGDGQGGLASCSPWGRKESDTTEQLNNHHRQGLRGVGSLPATYSPVAQEKVSSLYCNYSRGLRMFQNKKSLVKQNINLTLHPPILLRQWEGPKTKGKKKIVFQAYAKIFQTLNKLFLKWK